MKTEQLVVSIETASQLFQAGWDQPTNHVWQLGKLTTAKRAKVSEPCTMDAPQAQEIADQLPLELENHRLNIERQDVDEWLACYAEPGSYSVRHGVIGDTMAEALAALWLNVQRNKSVKK